MEDDDLADCSQQLLDALDATLSNSDFVAQLNPDDIKSVGADRDRVFTALALYRKLNYFTERRSTHPRQVAEGPRKGMLLPMAISATLAAPAELGGGTVAATGSGPGALLVVGEILLPIAIAVLVSQATGGSLQDSAARHLTDAANDLARDLLELGTVSTVMAITAGEAAALSPEELLEKLIEAAKITDLALTASVTAIQIIVAELIKRFPACAVAIMRVKDAIFKLNRLKRNPSLSGVSLKGVQDAIREFRKALRAMRDCVEGCIQEQGWG